MYNYSLFDSFFAPTRVIVVSEERLRAKEIELKENQVKVVNNRIDELVKYRGELQDELLQLVGTKTEKTLKEGTCDV
tara:strand:+ start:39 stop:269 length:231 start_codon:yes stop_codon:yes gene_type:complete